MFPFQPVLVPLSFPPFSWAVLSWDANTTHMPPNNPTGLRRSLEEAPALDCLHCLPEDEHRRMLIVMACVIAGECDLGR